VTSLTQQNTDLRADLGRAREQMKAMAVSPHLSLSRPSLSLRLPLFLTLILDTTDPNTGWQEQAARDLAQERETHQQQVSTMQRSHEIAEHG
jgi:hypothetical protein